MNHFLVFGLHPRLSLAEFRTIKPEIDRPILAGNAAVVVDKNWDGAVLMNLLGGTVKLGDLIGEYKTSEIDLEEVATKIMGEMSRRQGLARHDTGGVVRHDPNGAEVPLLCHFERSEKSPEGSEMSRRQGLARHDTGGVARHDTGGGAGKIAFGWNVHGGTPAQHHAIEKKALDFKRTLTKLGRSVRWVTSERGSAPSPAALHKLHLIEEGVDLNFFIDGERCFVGRTTHVQDPDAWSLRDYGRPVRDDENGMLPPKLARMMVNLGNVPPDGVAIDPFCGSGTVLMEVALATRASSVIGSDNDPSQIDGTQKNIAWLIKQHVLREDDASRFHVFLANATALASHAEIKRQPIDCVITEGYLGPPLRGNESQKNLDDTAKRITELWTKTLEHFHPLLAPRGRIIGIWPAFKTAHGMARVNLESEKILQSHYRLIDPLEDWETSSGPLLYHREGQRVMRRIVVMEKKS